MCHNTQRTITAGLMLFILLNTGVALAEKQSISQPLVITNAPEQAKANNDWKLAKATGKQAQIVFMSVSTSTNPKNEIGVETHKFDQVIFIVEGNGKAEINGKTQDVNVNDMIFIPQGTQHNIINLNADKALKLISIYSQTDIPANSDIKKKM